MPPAPVVRILTPDDVDPAWAALETAFGAAPHPEDRDVEHGVVVPERFYAAFDADRPVATTGSFPFSMTVPGARLPVAGITWVGVLPTYRRQGVMTGLMRRQLDDLRAEGVAVAALWASEGAIYGRFGYGPAAWTLALRLPRGAAFTRPVVADRLRLVDPAAAELPDVYAAVAAQTPGWPERDDAWWRMRLHDPEHAREGAGPLQAVVADGDSGGPEGYALYAVAGAWEGGSPAGTVRVREVAAATPGAHARLWRHLLDLDLTRTTSARLAAPDEPLLQLLAEPRSARAELRDCLWARLVDVPAALAARRYCTDLDVVLEVDDAFCPWNAGRWHVTGDRTGATCSATTRPADLVLSAADLGAAYLGGTPLSARSAAGHVEERTPGAVAVASTAFGPLTRAPWCPQVF